MPVTKKLPLLLIGFVLFSCAESDIEQFESGGQDRAIDRSGREYYGLDPLKIYCGPGWGRKFCRFLAKYEGTIWTDAENYSSDFSDITFSNFSGNQHFISFLQLDSTASYCEGWKVGETSYDGMKWHITIKRDEEDALWFDYDYYGSGEEIEYSILYKCEVMDGLLHFSRTGGQTFIFNPSESNYAEDLVDTREIMVLEGCMFF